MEPGAGTPPGVGEEVRRTRALTALARRWEVPVTGVIAAGGFGKTTALRQAVAENRLAERGIDRTVVCRAFDIGADDLASRMLAALEAPATVTVEDPVALAGVVVGAISAFSPVPVCLVLDDVHELGDATPATELVNLLVRSLPGNGHLVLCGRRVPSGIALARLRAADGLVSVGEDELGFDDEEIRHLTEHHGLGPGSATALGRWPALVRLSLTAGRSASMEFLRQELLDQLDPGVRRALGVAVLAGGADDALLAGLGCPVTAGDLAARVPLVEVDDSDRAVPHALWSDARDQLIAGPEVDGDVSAIGAHLVATGAHDEALASSPRPGSGMAPLRPCWTRCGEATCWSAGLRPCGGFVGSRPVSVTGPRCWCCEGWSPGSPTSTSATHSSATPTSSAPRPLPSNTTTPMGTSSSAGPRRRSRPRRDPRVRRWRSSPSCGGRGMPPIARPWRASTARSLRSTGARQDRPVPSRRSWARSSPPFKVTCGKPWMLLMRSGRAPWTPRRASSSSSSAPASPSWPATDRWPWPRATPPRKRPSVRAIPRSVATSWSSPGSPATPVPRSAPSTWPLRSRCAPRRTASAGWCTPTPSPRPSGWPRRPTWIRCGARGRGRAVTTCSSPWVQPPASRRGARTRRRRASSESRSAPTVRATRWWRASCGGSSPTRTRSSPSCGPGSTGPTWGRPTWRRAPSPASWWRPRREGPRDGMSCRHRRRSWRGCPCAGRCASPSAPTRQAGRLAWS